MNCCVGRLKFYDGLLALTLYRFVVEKRPNVFCED